MFKIETILAPVDFSKKTRVAAKHAAELAARFNAKLTYLHVTPPGPEEGLDYSGEERPEEAEAYAAEHLADWVSNRVQPGIPTENLVLGGEPAEQIAALAAERGFSLIVMPTHSRGRYRRFVLGSTTAKTLHDVDVPVLTGAHVKESNWRTADYRRIVCAVDLRERSETVLRAAADLAETFGASLWAAHVVPTFAVEHLGDRQDFAGMMVGAARARLDELTKEIAPGAQLAVERGKSAAGIRTIVDRLDADLVVIGRSTAEEQSRLGSDAYSLICRTMRPVLSV